MAVILATIYSVALVLLTRSYIKYCSPTSTTRDDIDDLFTCGFRILTKVTDAGYSYEIYNGLITIDGKPFQLLRDINNWIDYQTATGWRKAYHRVKYEICKYFPSPLWTSNLERGIRAVDYLDKTKTPYKIAFLGKSKRMALLFSGGVVVFNARSLFTHIMNMKRASVASKVVSA